MSLLDKAMGMLGAVNPQAAQKAKSEYSRYSPDIDGLKQAIAAWGGMAMVDAACDYVKTHPRVAGALRMANIDPEQIRQQLNNASPTQHSKNSYQSTPPNAYKDRLNKLR